MFVLITYDVATTDAEGRKRLRDVAKACLDYGQRVQKSVFECQLDGTAWAKLKGRLLAIMDEEQDSIRFYFLGRNWHNRVEHHGVGTSIDMEGPLIA